MILIQVSLYSNGCLKSLRAEGHALDWKTAESGESLPCGIVSAVLKTSAKLLYLDSAVETEGNATVAGRLNLRIKGIKKEKTLWVKGITDLLMSTFAEVKRYYPDAITVEFKEDI